MPGRTRWLPALAMAVGVTLLALGCGGGTSSSTGGVAPQGAVDQEARDKIALIEQFIGTLNGDPDKELLANLKDSNEYLREVIQDLKCEIYMLKQPAGTQEPDPCPPEGPSTRPTNPPSYPP